ncbi:MAG: hypothetical protein ACRDTU_10180 [Micromonosporaceae bacterium]
MTGYGLNLMMYDLRRPENRDAIRADLAGYLARYDLTPAEKQLVVDGDWQGCVDAGASVYVLTKIGAALDISLLHMGAQMRGETFGEFGEFVKAQNASAAEHALMPGSGGGERG